MTQDRSIVRHEINHSSETRSAAIERLKRERLTNLRKPSKVPRSVALRELHVEPLVFQVRADGLDADRIEEIAKGLQGTKLDDPLHIWWSGSRWIIIEGHHRYAAYRLKAERDGVTLKVPVEAHVDMTLFEARGAAGKLNDRDKVSISRAEKQDNAWSLVCMKEGSIAETVLASGASKSQISVMRTALADLEAWGRPIEQLLDSGWAQCREWANGKSNREYSGDELEELAHALADELKKVRTVASLVATPTILARALQIISTELPCQLLESESFEDALRTTGRAWLADHNCPG